MGELDEAVSEAVERGRESRLNSLIAAIVAVAATTMAVGNVKDANIVQGMAQAQAKTVDAWSYYQSKSTKQNIAEAALDQLVALQAIVPANGDAHADVEKHIVDFRQQVTRYDKEKQEIQAEAEGHQREYDELNLHDDQFDMSEAALSVAIALLGVTALTRKRWLLGVAALFLAVGWTFEVAGFAGWSLHPHLLMSWLG